MSIYGSITTRTPVNESDESILKSIVENTKLDEFEPMSVSESVQFQQDLLECMMDLYEAEDEEPEDGEEAVQEGANIDMFKEFKDFKISYREGMKVAKKQIKNKDYSAAKKTLAKIKSELGKTTTAVKKLDSTVGSAIFGWFAAGLLNLYEMLIPLSVTYAGIGVTSLGIGAGAKALTATSIEQLSSNLKKSAALIGAGGAVTWVGSVVTFIKSIIILVKDIKILIKEIDSTDSNTADKFNYFRTKIVRYLSELDKAIDKSIKIVDEKAKYDK